MPSVIRLVDKANDATILFDFNTSTGSGNPGSVKTFIMGDPDFGTIPSEHTFFTPENSPGGSLARSRHGLTEMRFRFRPLATTADNLYAGIGKLGQYLNEPSEYALLIQLDGWAEKRYADVVAGMIPALLRGQELGLFQTLKRFEDPDGVEVVLWRQPYLRGPSVTVGPTTVQNDPADASGRFIEVTNAGNAPAPAAFKVAGDTGAKVQEIVVARKSVGPFASTRVTDYTGLTQYSQLNASNLPTGWTVALSTGTTSVADAEASSAAAAFAAQTTHATDPTVMNKRIRLSRTTNLDSLRGTFDVYARIKNTAAAKHVVQLRWSHSLADPATFSEQEVIHDTTGLATFAYVDVKLGRISVPKEHMLGGVALEFWSRRDSGSGNLMWDFVSLVPADESVSTIVVPGGSSESWAYTQFLGGATASFQPAGLANGAVGSGVYVLNALNEALGTPPVGGLGWPVGRHRVTFQPGGVPLVFIASATITVAFRVRNITDNNDAVTQSISSQTTTPITVEFDSLSGKSYQPQAVITALGGAQIASVNVGSIEHEFVPYIASGEEAHSDPEKQMLHKMDSSDNIVSPLTVEGPLPLWLQPGLNCVYVHYVDVPVVSGAPGGESKLTRDCPVTVTFAPRYLQ